MVKHSLTLSKRLKKIAAYLPKGSYFADIGSDHAYLPCYVCLHDPTAKAIAGEVNEGPYLSAQKTVETYGLTEQIEVRLGDGLTVIQEDPITEVVIAGMGGQLIRRILTDGEDKLQTVKRVIVQPNIAAHLLREWFHDRQMTIVAEELIEENDHIYEIIVAEKTHPYIPLTEKECLFGPHLLKEKSAVFKKKWRREQQNYKRIIKQMAQASQPDQEKIQAFQKELQWIEEVLQDD